MFSHRAGLWQTGAAKRREFRFNGGRQTLVGPALELSAPAFGALRRYRAGIVRNSRIMPNRISAITSEYRLCMGWKWK
jgi:hypothetical protein